MCSKKVVVVLGVKKKKKNRKEHEKRSIETYCKTTNSFQIGKKKSKGHTVKKSFLLLLMIRR